MAAKGKAAAKAKGGKDKKTVKERAPRGKAAAKGKAAARGRGAAKGKGRGRKKDPEVVDTGLETDQDEEDQEDGEEEEEEEEDADVEVQGEGQGLLIEVKKKKNAAGDAERGKFGVDDYQIVGSKMTSLLEGVDASSMTKKNLSAFVTGLKYRVAKETDPEKLSQAQKTLTESWCRLLVVFYVAVFYLCVFVCCQKRIFDSSKAYNQVPHASKRAFVLEVAKRGGIKNLSWVGDYCEESEDKQQETTGQKKGFFKMYLGSCYFYCYRCC